MTAVDDDLATAKNQAWSTVAPIDLILSRLEGVRKRGADCWTARCPSHSDKTPSLSIRVVDDGVILLHDFGGCAAADICAALGLELGDLFPDRAQHIAPTRNRQHAHAWREALRALHRDCLVTAIAAENLAAGVVLDEADRELLWDAARKIRATVAVCAS